MFLTIENEKLVAKIDNNHTLVMESIQNVNLELQLNGGAGCSSKLDFPEEYTTDPKVIEMCRQVLELGRSRKLGEVLG